MIGAVTGHELITRDAGEDGMHHRPLRRGDLPAALGLRLRQFNGFRESDIGLKPRGFHVDPAPHHMTGLADALDRAATEAKIHRRLALADRFGIAGCKVRGGHGA